jgi:hypothetical protein
VLRGVAVQKPWEDDVKAASIPTLCNIDVIGVSAKA